MLKEHIEDYLDYCKTQRRLNDKTLKAYRIDLRQFLEQVGMIDNITPAALEKHIAYLHQRYAPKTVKRKIASLKALFHYLEYRESIDTNPFNKIRIHFREPITLPKTIPLSTIEKLLNAIYKEYENATSSYKERNTLRDIAIIELLFATGIRISELCSIQNSEIDLENNTVVIKGKGSKERLVHICNKQAITAIHKYNFEFHDKISSCGFFFINNLGHQISDQSVRQMINKYCRIANIQQHITPHMFRHSFASLLLEEDVDIRYIQTMLGHSSINVTEIYTHVSMSKQQSILASKHPRERIYTEWIK